MTNIPPDSAWQSEIDRPLIAPLCNDPRAMWMAQAESMGISPDIAADEWADIEARLEADLGAAFNVDPHHSPALEAARKAGVDRVKSLFKMAGRGPAVECAKTASEVKP